MDTPVQLDENLMALRGVQSFPAEWLFQGPPTLDLRADGNRLLIRTTDGTNKGIAFGGRGESERWLTGAFGSNPPAWVAIIGVGLGDILDAIWTAAGSTRVLVIEPEAALLRAFLGARDWRAAVDGGRLRIVGGSADDGPTRVWRSLRLATTPPLLVRPVLARQLPAYTARGRALYARARCQSSCDPRNPQVRRSMLHQDVLHALEQAASTVQGAILEIGAYVGGATAAMGRGLRSTGHRAPFLTIEPGGEYLTHPDLPSADICRDLRSFLEAERVSDRVELIQGYASDPLVISRIHTRLTSTPIGLLCIDADGAVLRDFRGYLPLCRAGALIVIDDYVSPHACSKTVPTQAGVNAAVRAGILKTIGVYGWGTWFGTLTRRVSAAELATLEAEAA